MGHCHTRTNPKIQVTNQLSPVQLCLYINDHNCYHTWLLKEYWYGKFTDSDRAFTFLQHMESNYNTCSNII